MDIPKPQNGHQVPDASGGSSASKPKVKNRRVKSKVESKEPAKIGFVVTTPDKFRVDLLKAKDHQDQVRALLNPSNSLKRTADLAAGDPSEQPEKRVKKNVGGRPRIHPVKPKSTVRFFKKRTRIHQSLYPDIWSRIFDFSTPEFLLQARQTSRMLRLLLQKESQWRTARYSTYGFDHPDPPPVLDEMQYADLLTGSGCQTKGCKEKSVRKVYWGFQRRWCPSCLRTNTIKVVPLHLEVSRSASSDSIHRKAIQRTSLQLMFGFAIVYQGLRSIPGIGIAGLENIPIGQPGLITGETTRVTLDWR